MLRPDALRGAVAPAVRGFTWRSTTAARHGSIALFLVAFVGYVLVGGLLVFRGGLILGDAWSRVGNAAWMIASRDPHFAAIGFVWNPLPSLVALPLVAVRGIWPPLVTSGFAANLVAAAFMAGSVVVMTRIASDLGVRRKPAAAVVGLFALNPMILLYGANGMSEAPFVFFLIVATRYLLVWWRSNGTYPLVIVGMALALAYLTRYEAVAAAGGALFVIGLRTYQRSSGVWRARLPWAAADVLVAGLPFLFAFVGWAVASWVITGNPFETFSSVYGNSSQVALAGSSIGDATGHGVDALRYALGEILGLAPGLPLLIGVAAAVATRRRSLDLIVPLAIFGGVLGFAVVTTVGGASFAWLRFSITAIPMSIILALLALAPPAVAPLSAPTEPLVTRHRRQRTLGAVLLVGVLVLVGLALPIGLNTMADPRIGREEADQLRAIAGGRDSTIAMVRQSEVTSEAARFIDDLGLPDGSVIVDVATGFSIVLQSGHPRQFVITPDRDFERILADPVTFDTHYLLVPSGSGYSTLDAVGRAYPALFGNGLGVADLVAEFGSGVFTWRLFHID